MTNPNPATVGWIVIAAYVGLEIAGFLLPTSVLNRGKGGIHVLVTVLRMLCFALFAMIVMFQLYGIIGR